MHESTALAGMVAIAVHGLTLLGDPFMHPTLSQIAVPFTIGYRPGFTGLGIIAGWLAVFLGLSLLRPPAHRREALAQGAPRDDRSSGRLGVVHTLGAGTDAGAALAAGDPRRHRHPDRVPVPAPHPAVRGRPARRAVRPARPPSARGQRAPSVSQRLHPAPSACRERPGPGRRVRTEVLR